MLFLGIGAGNLIKNTGIVTSIGPSPVWQSADPNGYACSASGCQGQGLSDLLFHQLQTALNKTNDALSRFYRQTGVAYPDPQLAVNGVLDAKTTASLDQIAMTNMVPGISVHLDSAGIAANAGNLIASMNNWLSTQMTSGGSTTPCDPATDKNCPTTGGGDNSSAGWSTHHPPPPPPPPPPPVDGSAPGRNNGGPQPTIYYCADGTKVTDPGMCNSAPQVYVCPDGSQVLDPSLCRALSPPPPPPSDGSSVSPPAPAPTTVTVSTAPDGSVTVNTAPIPTVDTTPRLFGFPRNWVVGSVAVAGGLLGIIVGVLAFKRHEKTH